MRMWMVNPRLMCNQHLLGEHLEIHMFVGTLLEGKSVKGYLRNGLLEVHHLKSRHSELVKEMLRRGMNHRSNLPKFPIKIEGVVDVKDNIRELGSRCLKCRKLIKQKIKL